MKILVLLLLACFGCATVAEPEIQHRDGAEIRLYKNSAEMMRALPPTIRALAGIAQIQGWYDRERKIIYSIDDPRIVEHELKHHREPAWTHPVSCTYLPC